jgi:hypothetical protein
MIKLSLPVRRSIVDCQSLFDETHFPDFCLQFVNMVPLSVREVYSSS